MGILNLEEYKRRLESGNPVTIQELKNELKVLIKEMIVARSYFITIFNIVFCKSVTYSPAIPVINTFIFRSPTFQVFQESADANKI